MCMLACLPLYWQRTTAFFVIVSTLLSFVDYEQIQFVTIHSKLVYVFCRLQQRHLKCLQVAGAEINEPKSIVTHGGSSKLTLPSTESAAVTPHSEHDPAVTMMPAVGSGKQIYRDLSSVLSDAVTA